MDLHVTSHDRGRCSVVDVAGEIDLYTAPQLRAHLDDLVAEGHHDLVIDMRQVAFMDSAGLGAFVHGYKRVLAAGGSMRLVCADERILRVFRIAGLTSLMKIHPSPEEAVAHCGATA